MPKIDVEQLTDERKEIVRLIVATRGENKGCLRASKPPVPKKVKVVDESKPSQYYYDYADEEGKQAGRAAYVWRMVAFYASPIHQHRCMPVTVDFDVPGDYQARKAEIVELEKIVKVIVDSLSLAELPGMMAWARALGMV